MKALLKALATDRYFDKNPLHIIAAQFPLSTIHWMAEPHIAEAK
jgi:hypothetical protein